MTDPDDGTHHIKIIAGLVTNAEGQLLLVRKRGTSAFMQPGGKIEPNELARETLAREILEELGCAIDPASVKYKGRFIAPAANEAGFKVDAELFSVELSGIPTAQAEIAEIVWMPPDNPEGLTLAPLTEHHVLPLV